jgi:hypothetical protein
MKSRLYFDADSMDRNLIVALRARGVDVLTALEADMIHREDSEHLEFATREGRVLYSFNVGDFMQLHSEYLQSGKHHAGIVLARQQHYSIGGVMRRLLELMATRSAEDLVDNVEFLSRWD